MFWLHSTKAGYLDFSPNWSAGDQPRTSSYDRLEPAQVREKKSSGYDHLNPTVMKTPLRKSLNRTPPLIEDRQIHDYIIIISPLVFANLWPTFFTSWNSHKHCTFWCNDWPSTDARCCVYIIYITTYPFEFVWPLLRQLRCAHVLV